MRLSRPFTTVVIAASLAVADLTALAVPAVAVTNAPPPPTEAPDLGESRPDAVSAGVAARTTGRRIEVTDATTETRRRWVNPDGTTTDEITAGPARVRRGDGWAEIDTTLAVADGAVRPAATVGTVSFSAGGNAGLASVSEDDIAVSLGWRGRLPKPTLDGATATYADVLPGVDIVVRALPAGFEQSFVLKNRAGAAAALRLPLTLRGVKPLTRNGTVVMAGADGAERAWLGNARMWDSAGKEAPVAVRVLTGTSGHELEMRSDSALMADPNLRFPVTVDPTLQIRRWVDTYANSGATTTSYGGDAYLKIGKRTSVYRSFIAFDLSEYANRHITDVTQFLGNVDSASCSAKTTTLHKVTAAWAPSSLTWNNQPAVDTVLATTTGAAGGATGSTCDATGWLSFNDPRLTQAYQAWAASGGNYGMRISTSETDTLAAKDFLSGEATSWQPRVNITFNSYPSVPASSLEVRPSSAYSVNGTTTTYTSSRTPTLTAGAWDVDGGDETRVDVEVYDNASNTLVGSGSSAMGQPTLLGRGWTVATPLTSGTTYKWRCRAFDGTDYSAWSAWNTFVVDTEVPAAPASLSSSTFPPNVWTSFSGTTGTFTWQPGSSDTASYLWGLDEATPTTVATSATATISNIPDGWHTLYVRGVDRAGNLGAVATYQFGSTPAITSPVSGSTTARGVILTALSGGDVDRVTYSYRRAPDQTFTAVPPGDVTYSATGGSVTWPVPWTPTSSLKNTPPSLTWDIAATLGGVDGYVEIQGCFKNSFGHSTCTTVPVSVTYDQNGIDSGNATADMGVGSLDLGTGNLAVSTTDVQINAYNSDLTLTRTANSKMPDAVPAQSPQMLTENQQSVETDTQGFGRVLNATIASTTAHASDGSRSLSVTATSATSADSFVTVGSDNGGIRLGMQPGRSYVFTTKILVPSGTGLVSDYPGRGLRAVVFVRNSAGAYTEITSATPTSTDVWTSLSVAFTVPVGSTEAFVRLYNGFRTGSSSKVVYYDQSSLREQGMFGLGWVPGLSVDAAGADYTGAIDTGSAVNVKLPDDSTLIFAKKGTSYVLVGEDAATGLVLSAGATGTYGAASYVLSDLDGNVTTFVPSPALTRAASATAPNTYVVSTVSQPGSDRTTTYTYSNGRVSRVLAPVPTGSTCTDPASPATWAGGCRALDLTYDTGGRLSAVTFVTNDPATGSKLSVDVACYAYSGHRLASVWDPRAGTPGSGSHPIACGSQVLARSYAYDAQGRLSAVQAPGLQPWAIAYDNKGRVDTVSRTHTSIWGGWTVGRTVRYDIALSGWVDTRPNMTPGEVARWGQSSPPITATAVFRPGAYVSTSDLRAADVTYIDVTNRAVNSATYSGTGVDGWHITTTEYDKFGNVVRTLSAANREEALNPTGAAGAALGLPNDTQAAAAMLDERSVYSEDGVDLLHVYGPYHKVTFDDGTTGGARGHARYTYDTGSETGHPAGGPMHLRTSAIESASRSPIADPAQTNVDVDERTTTYEYALSATDNEGWTFRTPLRTTQDPGGAAIASVARFDPATGVPTESWMPKASTATTAPADVDKAKSVVVSYTAGAHPAVTSCGNKPQWVNLPCRVGPKVQPGTPGLPGLPVTTYTYDYLLRPVTEAETVTAADGTVSTRSETTTYEAGGHGVRVVSVALTGSSGVPLGATTTTYDSQTGLPTSVSAPATTSSPASEVTTGYDDFGRVVSTSDADGNVATTTYQSNTDRVASHTNAKGSVTYGYTSGEYRGLPTSMTVSGIPGSFTAAYDSDGRLTSQTWPNGVTQQWTYDEGGAIQGLTAGTSTAQWWSETVSRNIHGQQRTRTATDSAQSFAYDAAERLTRVEERVVAGPCTVRTYAYDEHSNRTSQGEYPAAATGACQSSTGGVFATYGYDVVDRLQPVHSATGIVYDAWGRVVTLPAAEAGGTSDMTTTYYADGVVREQAQGGRSVTWTRDALLRLRAVTDSNGGATRTNHYDGGGDSPSWIAENATGTEWTRYVSSLTGDLVITIEDTGDVTYHVTDLHGDVVATAAAADTVPSSYGDSDEFGRPRAGAVAGRYGWLGGKMRSGDALGGTILMGARVYSPTLGRFLQTDPVPGGSANSYDYANQDSVNQLDLDGRVAHKDGGTSGVVKDRRRCTRLNSEDEVRRCLDNGGFGDKNVRKSKKKKKRKCPPGVKGASQVLGYRGYVTAADHAVHGDFARAGANLYGAELARRGSNAGIAQTAKRVGGRAGRFIAKLGVPLSLVATAVDYIC